MAKTIKTAPTKGELKAKEVATMLREGISQAGILASAFDSAVSEVRSAKQMLKQVIGALGPESYTYKYDNKLVRWIDVINERIASIDKKLAELGVVE